MKWSHLLVASASAVGLQFAFSAPAHASAAVLLGLPLAPVTGLMQQVPTASAVSCHNGAADPFLREDSSGSSKSSAILGGAPSKLELISLQQARQSSQGLPAKKIEPAAGGVRCQQFARSWSAAQFTGAVVRMPANPDNFLGSARLPLHRTSFDAQWERVRGSGLSSSALASLAAAHNPTPTRATLAAVNAWSNSHVRYEEDRDLYGKADYWATAGSTLRRGAGDCEDIAIVKMQALAALGVPRTDMYLTIARDMVRNADHALLVVRLEGKYWLLDNATDTPLDAAASYDYRPIMSFSTAGKWLHGYARDSGETSGTRLLAVR
ncbi:MAG TPA: transglutaminase-like cysteine peptidase [Novosphingobium sp.]|nr:transglutaminase-like cysteine peptidase [Novosphingobium sp.]